jgi:hypothetical protein
MCSSVYPCDRTKGMKYVYYLFGVASGIVLTFGFILVMRILL